MSFLTVADIENILGRKQHENLSINDKNLNFNRILITGSGGSLGQALINQLASFDGEILETDIMNGFKNLDVTNEESVKNTISTLILT